MMRRYEGVSGLRYDGKDNARQGGPEGVRPAGPNNPATPAQIKGREGQEHAVEEEL